MKIIKNTSVILFYFLFSFVFIFLIESIGINISNLKTTNKTIILILMDIILMTSLFFIYKKDLIYEFKIFKKNYKQLIKKYFKYWYIGLILMSISNLIINFITKADIAANEEIVRSVLLVLPVYGIFTTIIAAPIIEEIVFRKTFYEMIKSKYKLMIICGLTFGIIHVAGSYKVISDLLYIIPYGVFGVIFAYIYHESKTIFLPISMHLFHNAILVIFFFINHYYLG